jgi:DNA-binding transcriptional ArsR family regulator
MSRRATPDDEPVWRALADPTRRAILDTLRAGPRTTGALAERFPITRFAVMKHLGVLVDAGLVTAERRGRERLNHVDPVPLQQACRRWARPFPGSAGAALPWLADEAEHPMDYGLDVHARHTVRTPTACTWEVLLDLARWWPPCWPSGQRLVFEPRLGGRLGTTTGADLDSGARALWGLVTGFEPGRELRLDGAMDIPGPVLGQWRMRLEPAGPTTTVTLEHRVLGPVDEETAAGCTRRWLRALAALADRAER